MINTTKVLTEAIDSSGAQSVELRGILHELQLLKDKINALPRKTRYDRLKSEALLQVVNDTIKSLKKTIQHLDEANRSAHDTLTEIDHLNTLMKDLHFQ